MTKSLLPLAAAAFALSACTGPMIMGTDAAVIYVTKPGGAPAADTKDQIAQHESWCYQTLADSQCFAHPQNVPPDRLINTDPQNLYPLDVAAYHQALMPKPPAPIPVVATGEPVMLDPAVAVSVEKSTLKDELNASAQVPMTDVKTP